MSAEGVEVADSGYSSPFNRLNIFERDLFIRINTYGYKYFHFLLLYYNFTPINRNFTMKIKINWLLIIALIALVFCVSYLISHLIIKKLYIDAAFVVAIVVLFPLLVYSVRHGK